VVTAFVLLVSQRGCPRPAAAMRRCGVPPTRRPLLGEAVISDRAVKAEADHAGLSVAEYLRHLGQQELYCYRCQDFHPFAELGPGHRCPCGRATFRLRSIRDRMTATH